MFINRIKIGKSSRTPNPLERKNLTIHIPESFKVEFSAFIENFDEIEKQVHKVLDQHRPNKNREFLLAQFQKLLSVIEIWKNKIDFLQIPRIDIDRKS